VYPSDLWDKETLILQPDSFDLGLFRRRSIGVLQVKFQKVQCVIILGLFRDMGIVHPWCKLLPLSPSPMVPEFVLKSIFHSEVTRDLETQFWNSESLCKSLGIVCSVKDEVVVGRRMYLVRLRSISSDFQGSSIRVS
jgi:hypothetical protein